MQESLSRTVKKQICEEIGSLPELCRFLENLDIGISFLKTIGGPPDDSLEAFLTKKLLIEQPMCSEKVFQFIH